MEPTQKSPLLPVRVKAINPDHTLIFEQLNGSLFDPQIRGFIGGKFKQKSLSKDGWPVWIKVENDCIIIEQLENCLVDKERDAYIGGELKTLLKIDLK